MIQETRHHFASEPYNEIAVQEVLLWMYCWWLDLATALKVYEVCGHTEVITLMSRILIK
jgi:hypothetical protein